MGGLIHCYNTVKFLLQKNLENAGFIIIGNESNVPNFLRRYYDTFKYFKTSIWTYMHV